MTKHTSELRHNQQGLVSIVVTMIIMIILSLIVTGFAQIARREQRQVLDKQLASQALYAAESGVNDVRRAINDPVNPYTANKTTCGPITDGSAPALSDNKVSANDNVTYSCLLVDQTPPDVKTVLPPEESKTVTLNAVDSSGAPGPVFENFRFSWAPKDSTLSLPPDPGTGPAFPPAGAGNWGDAVGLVRVDILPKPVGPFNSDTLANSTYTVYLYPSEPGRGGVATNTATYATGSANQGLIAKADCSSGTCEAEIRGLSSASYYMRLKAIYGTINTRICANNCDGSVHIQGAQAEVDVTGKANDVLKRIKVRIDNVSETFNMKRFPQYVLDSKETICKQYSLWPGGSDSTTTCP